MCIKKSDFEILDVNVNSLTKEELLLKLENFINIRGASFDPKLIGYVNLHGLYVSKNDKEMYEFYSQSHLNYIDGMPIVWLGKLFGCNVSSKHRITLLDYVFEMLEFCKDRGYRIAWVGGTEESINKGIGIIKSKVPNINILGIDGYRDDDYYLQSLNNFKPNLILVGLGMPRQEKWSLRFKNKLSANVIWNIGATIDFISGKVYVPPSWAGRFGLDWLFRYISEPNRMFFRYFIEPFFLFYYLILDIYTKNNNHK